MSQNDYIIANQTAPAFRADLNNALQALVSLSSGASAPTTTYANMLWYDTGTNILKMRTEANDAWMNIGYLDQTANAFRVLDDTQVVNTSGTQTGLIGDQATATWEAGTATTESLVSPAKIKAAIESLATTGFGSGQTWQSVSRSSGTTYQNTTGRPIMVAGESAWQYFGGFQVSVNGSTWINVLDASENDFTNPFSLIVPNNWYYRVYAIVRIAELR